MIVELHLLQNFAPANLNRDDTGSPKDCVFGGHRRARISSQAQKRAIRSLFAEEQLVPANALGERTKRLVELVATRLVGSGRLSDESTYVADRAVQALDIKKRDTKKRPTDTSYLVFIGADEIERLFALALEHWESLYEGFDSTKKGAPGPALPKDVTNRMKIALDGRRAVDVGLFGRMLAELPDRNRDAAAQVAHAISVNRVEIEFDFFTAVDDIKDRSQADEDAGAGMLGTIEFNSACFYRYFNVDLGQLSINLGGDKELVEAALRAYLRAAVTALPTGKQNSFAAHQAPSFIHSVVRDRGLQSLANAFVKPVSASQNGPDLIANSVSALDGYLGRQSKMYGEATISKRIVCLDSAYSDRVDFLNHSQVDSFGELIEQTVAAALPA